MKPWEERQELGEGAALIRCRAEQVGLLSRFARDLYRDTFASLNTSETMDAYLREAFAEGKLLAELNEPHSVFYLVTIDGKLAAYLKLNEPPAQSDLNEPGTLEIERVYVDKEHQGKGLGRRMLGYAESTAQRRGHSAVWLGVWEKNHRAIAFYRKRGYAEAGRHPYRMGQELQNDLIFRKTIAGAPGARQPPVSEEMLAVFDKDGRKIGLKPRSAVHRDGDWHMLAFVWAARRLPGGRSSFLLQIRGRPDDRFRGHVDAPAGGHVVEGEDALQSAVRECREEMGLDLSGDDLLYLGRRQVETTPMDCQRTFQHHYLCRRPLTLADVRLTEEVTGFLETDLDDFAALVAGQRQAAAAKTLARNEPGVRAGQITREALALYSREVRETFRRAVIAARSVLESGVVDDRIFA